MGPNSCPIEFEHVFGEPASLQDRTHEGEEGNGEQQFVGENAAEHAARNCLQEVQVEKAEMNGEKAERKPDGGQRERDRESDQHGDYQAAEHQRRHHLQRNHCVGLSYFASIVTSPRSAAMRLITSETPCSASSTKPDGITNLMGQRTSPPALPDISPTA